MLNIFKRLRRLEQGNDELRKEMNAVRAYLNVNSAGYQYADDQPTIRDLYAAFGRQHELRRGTPTKWVPK